MPRKSVLTPAQQHAAKQRSKERQAKLRSLRSNLAYIKAAKLRLAKAEYDKTALVSATALARETKVKDKELARLRAAEYKRRDGEAKKQANELYRTEYTTQVYYPFTAHMLAVCARYVVYENGVLVERAGGYQPTLTTAVDAIYALYKGRPALEAAHMPRMPRDLLPTYDLPDYLKVSDGTAFSVDYLHIYNQRGEKKIESPSVRVGMRIENSLKEKLWRIGQCNVGQGIFIALRYLYKNHLPTTDNATEGWKPVVFSQVATANRVATSKYLLTGEGRIYQPSQLEVDYYVSTADLQQVTVRVDDRETVSWQVRENKQFITRKSLQFVA